MNVLFFLILSQYSGVLNVSRFLQEELFILLTVCQLFLSMSLTKL